MEQDVWIKGEYIIMLDSQNREVLAPYSAMLRNCDSQISDLHHVMQNITSNLHSHSPKLDPIMVSLNECVSDDTVIDTVEKNETILHCYGL